MSTEQAFVFVSCDLRVQYVRRNSIKNCKLTGLSTSADIQQEFSDVVQMQTRIRMTSKI